MGYKNLGRYGGKNSREKGRVPYRRRNATLRKKVLEVAWYKQSVISYQVTIFNVDGIKSLRDIVRKDEKNGDIEA